MTKKYMPALSVALLAMTLPARADIYKCVGSDGHVTYANVADKSCKRLTLDPPAPAAAKPAARSASASAPTPTNFPKVEDSAQRSRDSDRRRILENELETEQRNRDQARKALAEQEAARPGHERTGQKTGDSLQTFKDRLALHERNIEAIRSELSRIR